MRKPIIFTRRNSSDRAAINPFLKDIVKSFRATIGAVFVFSFFLNLLMLTVPLYLVQIYDKVLPNQNFDTLLFLTGIAMVAVLALGLLESVRRTVLAKLGVRFDNDVSEHLLSSAIHRSVRKSYASVNIMRDLATLRRFLSGSSMFPMLDLPWTPMFILILYLLHPLIGIFGMVGAVLLFGIAVLNEYTTRDGVRSTGDDSRQMLDEARSYLRNSDVVQAMGMQSSILSGWKTRNAEVLASTYRNGRINTRLLLASKMLRLFLQVGIIGTAAWLILRQELTPGGTMASVLILRRAIAPLEQSIYSWKSVIRARAAFSNISEYLDNSSSLITERDMPVPGGTLVAHKASFRRSGQDRSVFSRIELIANPGKITAIVGPTAEGKSTMIRVLAGIVPPTSGKITLGGYELHQWTPEQLGPSLGYLPQDVCLFPGTVRDNISRMTEQPIEDVIAAATLANAHQMIQNLPQGYDTEISEEALNLSGGQRQRIGLARAVFGNPNTILLDEPDANLDSSGRSLLRKTLRKLRRNNIAVLVITHHTSLEKLADRVYRLESGKLSLVRSTRITENLVEQPETTKIEPVYHSTEAGNSANNSADVVETSERVRLKNLSSVHRQLAAVKTEAVKAPAETTERLNAVGHSRPVNRAAEIDKSNSTTADQSVANPEEKKSATLPVEDKDATETTRLVEGTDDIVERALRKFRSPRGASGSD